MAKSRAQQAAIAISMKKAGKKPKSLPKAQDGGWQNVSKSEKKYARRKIKDDIKQKTKVLNSIDPDGKSQNRKIGREVRKEKLKTLRKFNMLEVPEQTIEQPTYYAKAKKGGVIKTNTKTNGKVTSMAKKRR